MLEEFHIFKILFFFILFFNIRAQNYTFSDQLSAGKATYIILARFQTCFFIMIYETELPPLWSSGQSSWLQIRRPGFDSRHCQKKKAVGLERGPFSLVSTTEELLDRKVLARVWKTESTAVGIRHADHLAPSILIKLAVTSPTIGGRSVGIVRSRTQTMEFLCTVLEIRS
jgi:hypothetical protein